MLTKCLVNIKMKAEFGCVLTEKTFQNNKLQSKIFVDNAENVIRIENKVGNFFYVSKKNMSPFLLCSVGRHTFF